MSRQTSFDLEDAETLLKQLQRFHETIRQDWSKVLSQWANLRSVWHDQQFDKFEPLFEKLTTTYSDSERECEEYIAFMQDQIRIAEDRRAKMGALKDL